MAYVTKYQLYCKGKDGITSKAVISEDGYAGAEIDRDVPANPFFLMKDAAGVIRGTSFEFLIRETTDFEFLTFYTNKPKKYKIEFYYPSTMLMWSGYLNPQQYSVPYIPGPSNIRFQATDGLGLLKNEDFTLTGFNSELTKIRHCLDKIGLGLAYAIAIGIHEISHNAGLSPLEQTFIDCEIYEGKNCYEVLEDILTKYESSLTQWNNRWRIVSYKDKKMTRLLYSSAGVYDTTEAAPAVLDLGIYGEAGCEVYPSGRLQLGLQSGGNKVKITHDYGRKKSLLLNYDFSKYVSYMFTDWTKSGSFTPTHNIKNGKYFAYLGGYSNVDTDYIQQSIGIINVASQGFVFEIDFAPVGHSFGVLSGMDPISMKVRVLVSLLVGATTYYLTTTGWDTTLAYIEQTVTSAVFLNSIAWNNLKILTDEIPGDGTLTVRLQRYKNTAPGPGTVYSGVAFSEPSVYFLNEGELYADKFEDTATFDDSTEPAKLDDITILAADAPVLPNAKYLYRNITKLSTGAITTTWHIDGADMDLTLITAYLKMLASRNIHARQMLKGIIKGTGIGFESLIKHAYNSNREFEIHECSWDVYAAKFTVTLLEFLAYSDQDITLALGGPLAGSADLILASVTPASYSVVISTPFNITVHIDNTGESAGRKQIEWKIVDGSDNIISSGTQDSGSIPALGDEDVVWSITSPDDIGTYYVKCRMATDIDWVSSSAITVNRIFEAASTEMHFLWNESGSGAEKIITLTITPDVTFSLTNHVSAWATAYIDQGANTVSCYPNSTNSGAPRAGILRLSCAFGADIVIAVTQDTNA